MIYWSLILLTACAHTNAQNDGFALEHAGDGIYVHHGKHLDIDTGYQGDICNISFIVGSKGVAVIDTGGSYRAVSYTHLDVYKRQPLRSILPVRQVRALLHSWQKALLST